MISGKLLAGTLLAAAITTSPPTKIKVEEADTVLGLRQSGWAVVEKQVHDVKRPGVAPYYNMSRIISVTTYVLEKGTERRKCTLARDTMLEKFEQTCGPVGK